MTTATSPVLESLSSHDSRLLLDPEPEHSETERVEDEDDRSSDGDTASQRSISLSSPPRSPRTSTHETTPSLDVTRHADPLVMPVALVRQGLANANRESHTYTLDTDVSSEHDYGDDRSSFMRRLDGDESPFSSVAPSLHETEEEEDKENVKPGKTRTEIVERSPKKKNEELEVIKPEPGPQEKERKADLDDAELEEEQDVVHPLPNASSRQSMSSRASVTSLVSPSSYPPPPRQSPDPRGSVASFASVSSSISYSKKVRPESMLIKYTGPLVLGIALVDFNHLVGPKIEFSKGDIFDDEELAKILPFLALPDGAHLTVEDYSYFHLVPSAANPTTIFAISCNRQIRTKDLLVKDQEVTRSTVQKAVVVLASKPLFGPIRDRLGVITRALFAQRDFSDMSILEEFQASLEFSLRGQLTESGLYMGTSLRELVHTFRQRTLVLLKALMMQKKIMFYGHPVEKLCTYQYSLVALVPGLLQNLDDCGSPPLANRAQTLKKPTELRTSDPKSVMAYTGLPLDLFGKDAFFQPYLPLQQLDMLRDTKSWLCGSTNSIVAQQKEVELLVNMETCTFEFHDPKLERSAGLTPADRKWMDDIVKDVNDSWDETDPTGGAGIQFKGSDDYLRQKFDEYISGALACVKYADFLAKGQNNGVVIDGTGNPNAVQDFNMLWISEFKKTNAYEVWDRVTDSMFFDIVEPRHPCGEKPSVVADIGLRLSEGLQDLKLDQQLAPTRDAISRTFTAGSTSFFKAVEGVRDRWIQRNNSSPSNPMTEPSTSASSSLVDISKSDTASVRSGPSGPASLVTSPESSPTPPVSQPGGMRPLSLVTVSPKPAPQSAPAGETKSTFSSWGAGIGSFFSQRNSRLSLSRQSTLGTPLKEDSPAPSAVAQPPKSRAGGSIAPADLGVEELHPRNLDEMYAGGSVSASSTTLPPQPAAEPRPRTPIHAARASTDTFASGRHSDDGGEHVYEGTGVAL